MEMVISSLENILTALTTQVLLPAIFSWLQQLYSYLMGVLSALRA